MGRRELHRLSAVALRSLSQRSGMHPDGGGLYLQVTKAGVPSWTFRYMVAGRERYMGLGPFGLVSLAEARQKAITLRKARLDGVDPIAQRRAERAAQRAREAKAMTFRECAEAYIAAHRASWKNAGHRRQWEQTLAQHTYPALGALPVSAIDTGLVLKAIEPIWTATPETANRTRGRIEVILDWAKVRGYRDTENPARWRGHLDKLLPPVGKVKPTKHHAALPYAEIGAFMQELQQREGGAPLALQFLILTAVRTNEALGARWREIDLAEGLWVIPAERMKGGREGGKEHRVPLSPAALAILPEPGQPDAHVWPGRTPGTPLVASALRMLMRRMGHGDLTIHGFRSAFSDWCAEMTNFPAEIREAALAHVVGNAVERAYRRGDLFQKRRQLMDAWAGYCSMPASEGATSKVVSIRG